MTMQFDHLGLVVPSLRKGREVLRTTLSIRDWTEEFEDGLNGVRLQFGRDPAGMCYELLEPIDEKSPVYRALNTRSAILNHVAYRVEDLATNAHSLRQSGCAPTSAPRPAIAYGGCKIQFFITPLTFIIELIEKPRHQHQYQRVGDN